MSSAPKLLKIMRHSSYQNSLTIIFERMFQDMKQDMLQDMSILQLK